MTFNANETARESASPVEIYLITQGSDVFRFTTADEDQVVDSQTYTAESGMSRTRIQYSPNARKQAIGISFKANNSYISRYIGVQPSATARVVISRFHRNDTPTPEVVRIFEGVVRAVTFEGDGFTAQADVVPESGLINKPLPLYTHQSQCNHVLFDTRCKVNQLNFQFSGTVTAVSSDGITLTVAGIDAAKGVGFATSGRVELTGGSDFRTVQEHSATDQIKILSPFRESPLNTTVTVTAGCDHSIQVCKSKFDNVVNFGGFAFVPDRNIFERGVQ